MSATDTEKPARPVAKPIRIRKTARSPLADLKAHHLTFHRGVLACTECTTVVRVPDQGGNVLFVHAADCPFILRHSRAKDAA